MSISRPQLPTDPFQRPATVAYTPGQHAQQPGHGNRMSIVGAPQGYNQWGQKVQQQQVQGNATQWGGQQVQQAPQPAPAGYNPALYGPMPGGQAPTRPNTYQPDMSQPQQSAADVNNRWSTAGSFAPQASQPPVPPPKDNVQYTQPQQPQRQSGQYHQGQWMGGQAQQYPPPASQSPHQTFGGHTPPAAPPVSQSPQQIQNYGHPPPAQTQQGYGAVQNQAYQHHPNVPSQQIPQWQGQGQQQQQQQYPPQYPPQHPPQPQQLTQQQPLTVSPVHHGRQDSGPSRDNSYTGSSNALPGDPPSAISSSPSRPQDRRDNLTAPSNKFEGLQPKKRVVDPNGIGSTGASALGLGGPSDWETFTPGGFDEVDDLELYATKKIQKKEEPEEVKIKQDAPVELPAETPTEAPSAPWNGAIAGVVEIDGGAPVQAPPQMHQGRPPSVGQSLAAPANAVLDGGIIMAGPAAAPVPAQAPAPVGHPPPVTNQEHVFVHSEPAPAPAPIPYGETTQQIPPRAAVPPVAGSLPGHSMIVRPTSNEPAPSQQGFIIDSGSGWHQTQSQPYPSVPPHVAQAQVQAMPSSHPQVQGLATPPVPLQSQSPAGAVIVEGGWVPPPQQTTQQQFVQSQPSNLATPTHPAHPPPQATNAFIPSAATAAAAVGLAAIATHHHTHPTAGPPVPPTQPPGPTHEEYAQLRARLSERDNQLASFHQEAALQKRLMGEASFRQAEEEVVKLREKVGKLETQCQSTLEQFTSMERTLEQSESHNYTLENENKTLEQKLAYALKEVESFKTRNEEQAGEIGRMKVQMEEVTNQKEAAMNLMKRAEEEIGNVKKQKDDEMVKMRKEMEEETERKQKFADEEMQKMKKLAEEETHKLKELAEEKTQKMSKEIEDLKAELGKEREISKKAASALAEASDIAPGMDVWYKESLIRIRAALFAEMAAWPIENKAKVFRTIVIEEAKKRNIAPLPFGDSEPVSKDLESSAEKTKTVPIQPVSGFASPGAEDEEYSPGGRPVIGRKSVSSGSNIPTTTTQAQVDKPLVAPVVTEQKKESPSFKPFIPYRKESDASATPVPEIPGPGVAGPVRQSTPASDQVLPVYKGFKYEPPAALQKVVSAKEIMPQPPVLHRNAASTPAVVLSQQHKMKRISLANMETFIPPETLKDRVADSPIKPELVPQPLKPMIHEDLSRRIGVAPEKKQETPKTPLAKLESMLPSHLRMPNPANVHPILAPFYTQLASYSANDFSFVRALSTSFDANLKKIRQRQESEREARMQQAQEDPNRLFNSGEIKYADLNDLESELRKREDKIRDSEDNDVWKMYVDEVFTPTYERIMAELRELVKIDASLDSVLNSAVAGGRGLDANSGAGQDVALIDALHLVLRTNELINARSMESHKVIVERDLQYKRNYLRGLYRRGETAELKRVEQHLKQNALKQDFSHKQERLKKIQSLWKRVKQASFDKGVEQNTSFALSLLAAAEDAAKDPQSNRQALQESLKTAQLVLEDLSANSLALMNSYAAVDATLNEGEYEFMVAEEKLSGAGEEVFDDLAKQKRIQDGKLVEETKVREEGRKAEGKAWLDSLHKLFGDDMDTSGKGKTSALSEEERLREEAKRRTLDDAKRRNGEFI